jgi:hypothetical protein
MRSYIVLSALIIVSFGSLAQRDVNRYLFAVGMEYNRWNYDVFYGTYCYFNFRMDSNTEIYNEAVYVLNSHCLDFYSPTVDNSVEDEGYDFCKLIFEKDIYESDSATRIENTYENEDVKIMVGINNFHSYIRVYMKE